jgi:hypothetical protein
VKEARHQHFTVGNYTFGKVHTFKYLGSLATDKNDIIVAIKNRIELGNKCYYGIRQCLSNCGPRTNGGPQVVTRKSIAKIVLDSERMNYSPIHVCILKVPLFVDLEQK